LLLTSKTKVVIIALCKNKFHYISIGKEWNDRDISGGNFYLIYDSDVLNAVNTEPTFNVFIGVNIFQLGMAKIAFAVE